MAPMKGVRKRKDTRPTVIRIGKFSIPSQVAITGLMALLYVWVILCGAYSRDSFLMQLLYFAMFAGIIFLLRGMQPIYTKLGYAFLALAITPLLWGAVEYLGYGPAVPDIVWYVYIGLINLVLGFGLVVALLYYEKGKMTDLFVQAGDLKQGLIQGGFMFLVLAAMTVAAAFMSFGADHADSSLLYPALGGLLVFAVACGFVEELWFRGLLLTRLLPLVDKNVAYVISAIAFAAYEAVFLYMFTSSLAYAGIVFVVAAALGVVWAWITVRNRSILAPALSHAGIYLILALPVFAAFF